MRYTGGMNLRKDNLAPDDIGHYRDLLQAHPTYEITATVARAILGITWNKLTKYLDEARPGGPILPSRRDPLRDERVKLVRLADVLQLYTTLHETRPDTPLHEKEEQ